MTLKDLLLEFADCWSLSGSAAHRSPSCLSTSHNVYTGSLLASLFFTASLSINIFSADLLGGRKETDFVSQVSFLYSFLQFLSFICPDVHIVLLHGEVPP